MKKRQMWKRAAAWVLSVAMIAGSNSFAALAEETEVLPSAAEVAETEAPAVEAEAPVVETEAPAVETEAPAVETEAPAVEAEAPAVETEAPAVETEASVVETEVPAVEAEAPAVEAETPDEDAAETATEVPKDGTEIAGTEPETAESEAQQEETQPADAEEELIVSDVEPAAEEEIPDLPQMINADNGKVPETIDGVLTDGCSVEVSLESGEECKWYTFTPEQDGRYVIYSEENNGDPCLYVYTESTENPGKLEYLDNDDDGAGGLNFRLARLYEANKTYYFECYEYDAEESTYQVHFQSVPELTGITLEIPEDKTWISGYHSMSSVLSAATARLTYADGKTLDMDSVRGVSDAYGTRLDYEVQGIEDMEDSPAPGTYTLSVSAFGCSASANVTFISMADAAAANMIAGETTPVTAGLIYAGFAPKESGGYVLSDMFREFEVYDIYDVQTQERISFSWADTVYRTELEAGKTYLLILEFYSTEEENSVTVKKADAVDTITLTGLRDTYGVYEARTMGSVTATVTYAGSETSENVIYWSKNYYGEEEVLYYYGYTEQGDRIDLTLWNGTSQVSMPDMEEGTPVGTFTLKAMIGEKEYFSKTVTITASESIELSLNGSYTVTSDQNGYICGSYKAAKTGLYEFIVSDFPEEPGQISLYGSKNNLIRMFDVHYGGGKRLRLTEILNAGETYTFRALIAPSVSAKVSFKTADPEILAVGSQTISGLGYESDSKWFRITPADGSRYTMTVSGNEESGEYSEPKIELYGEDFQRINWSYYSLQNYLSSGKTYYIRVYDEDGQEDFTITLSQVDTQKLSLGQELSVSGNSMISFIPSETASYCFRSSGLAASDYRIRLMDELENGIDSSYGEYEELEWNCVLEAGETYLLSTYFYEGDCTFKLTVSRNLTAKSVAIKENSEMFMRPGDRKEIYKSVSLTYSTGAVWDEEFYGDNARTDTYGYTLRSGLYEADAYGTPNYDKKLWSEDDGMYTFPKAGIYAWAVRAGYYNGYDEFVPVADIEPAVLKIFVTEAEHTAHKFTTVTEKAAACGTAGSTVNCCTVCGYKDPASVKTVPATGKHTGGKATCVKKAVCAVCGQEYGALAGHTGGKATCEKGAVCTVCGKEYTAAAGHSFSAWKKTSDATVFKKAVQTRTCSVCGKKETQETGSLVPATIKLNASSLKMKTKQKTTKLTVTMGAGDSVVSVKSSNTKVLKASVKKNKITLTAQKKTGKANLTVKLASGKSKTIKVTVQSKSVATTKIKGVSKKLTLKKKQKSTLKPTLEPITSQDKIKYTSSNKKVATVSSKGVITAKGKGKATITIKAGKKSFKCTVTVK